MQSSTYSAVWNGETQIHPVFYVMSWIFFSNITILFNKWLLDTAGFRYPVLLTTIHLATATVLTQLLARFTGLLSSRHSVKLSRRLYLRAVLPIGVLYTLSLICSNLVCFIQMLKAFAPVSTLLISWVWGVSNPPVSVLYTVCIIALGVLLSSVGEVRFSWLGFGFQMAGTLTESCRLLLIQILLTREGEGVKMDPLVGLYYYAPICALLNAAVALVTEVPRFDPADLERVGVGMLALNGIVAFMLNVSSVFLIGRTSALAMNLTGILKSILLVVASLIIWKTPIRPLQCVGYAVALVGMFYYSMGPDTARAHLHSCRAWVGDRWNWKNTPSLSVVRRLLASPWAPSSYSRVPSDLEAVPQGNSRDLEEGDEKLGVSPG